MCADRNQQRNPRGENRGGGRGRGRGRGRGGFPAQGAGFVPQPFGRGNAGLVMGPVVLTPGGAFSLAKQYQDLIPGRARSIGLEFVEGGVAWFATRASDGSGTTPQELLREAKQETVERLAHEERVRLRKRALERFGDEFTDHMFGPIEEVDDWTVSEVMETLDEEEREILAMKSREWRRSQESGQEDKTPVVAKQVSAKHVPKKAIPSRVVAKEESEGIPEDNMAKMFKLFTSMMAASQNSVISGKPESSQSAKPEKKIEVPVVPVPVSSGGSQPLLETPVEGSNVSSIEIEEQSAPGKPPRTGRKGRKKDPSPQKSE